MHDEDGNILVHTDGTGYISEDLAQICPKDFTTSLNGRDNNTEVKTKIVVVAAVCFAKAPSLLGQAFFLIYEGVRRRPEARRCLRPIWGGARGQVHGPRGATPFGTPAPSCVHLLSNLLLFHKK